MTNQPRRTVLKTIGATCAAFSLPEQLFAGRRTSNKPIRHGGGWGSSQICMVARALMLNRDWVAVGNFDGMNVINRMGAVVMFIL